MEKIEPGRKPSQEDIDAAAALGAMESGLMGVGFQDMRTALEGITEEQLEVFVQTTQERAQQNQ